MKLLLGIALTHLRARGRQSLLAVLGVALGVGFSVAMAALMQGTQDDFIDSLVDAIPHVLVSDERREPPPQPAQALFDAVAVEGLRPDDDPRGILNPTAALASLRAWVPGAVSADLAVQGVARYGGRDVALSLLGIEPEVESSVSSLADDVVAGSLSALQADASGIVLGDAALDELGAKLGDGVLVTSSGGVSRRFKVVAVFDSGVQAQDEGQGYVLRKTAQVLANRPDAVTQIRLRLADEQAAPEVAARVERQLGYKAVSWQEANQPLLESFVVRDVIMYTVVGAILLVAGFGIFNVVSTIIQEKARDIAIMKSLGFPERDMRRLFLAEGLAIGLVGCAVGAVIGYLLTGVLGSIEFVIEEGGDPVPMPVAYSPLHYLIASACALASAGVAGYLPARKAARLNPVDIIRGAA